MEEMEEDPPSPFWLPSTTVRHHQRRRAASSLFLNTGVLVVFLLAAAIVFLVIVIPSVLSLARQVFNPSSVKSSWNSLNILLVVFAIVCGFLGRREEDSTTPASSPVRGEVEEREYQSFRIGSDDNGGRLRRRLRRNSTSYPDLREESSVWEMRETQRENQWRFYDDTDLNNQLFNQRFERQISYRTRSQPLPIIDEDVGGDTKTIQVDTSVDTSPKVSPPPEVAPPPAAAEAAHDGSKQMVEEAESDSNTVEIDTPAEDLPRSNPPPEPSPPPSPMGVILPPPSPTTYLWPPPSPNSYLWPPPSPSPPPPPPPPPPPRRRAQPPAVTSKQQIKEIYETIGRPGSKSYLPPPSPPPPPPEIGKGHSEEKREKSGKKRGVATKEFLVSFYHQTKRKRKQKRRSYENLDEIMEPQPPKVSIYRSKSTPEFPPPSPPRAPPPAPPPPPPPPPPPSVFHNLFSSRKAKSKKKVHSVSTPASTSASRPPKDKRRVAGNGSEPLLIPAPPPPPPPAWKVAMRGDYVKPESSNNSSPRSGCSVSQDDEGSSPSNCRTPPAPAGFCASPDVNSKAEDFIATFRAKLKLEKMDSIKQKETATGLSPLGPEPRQN